MMGHIIEIEFKARRREFYYNNKELELYPNQYVIVEAERGIDIGKVIQSQDIETNNQENFKVL